MGPSSSESPKPPERGKAAEKENTPSGSTPGQASERPEVVVWRCPECHDIAAHADEYENDAYQGGPWCEDGTVQRERLVFVPASYAESLEAQIVELKEALERIERGDFVAGGMYGHVGPRQIAREALSDKADGEAVTQADLERGEELAQEHGWE